MAFSVPAWGQSVALHVPGRDFGYFVGDVIVTEAVVTTREDDRVDRRSLPVPGPLTASIDLLRVDMRETLSHNTRKTVLRMEYQSFFAPEQVASAELPAYDLRFTSSVAHVPAWQFHVSPLRVAQRSIDALADLHGDLAIAPVPDKPALVGLLVSAAFTLLAAAAFAGTQGWLPHLRRNRQPFAAAAHRIARLGPAATDNAMQELLHAFDATDGRHVFAGDLDAFFLRNAAFADLRAQITQFFDGAKRHFFAPPHAATGHDTDFAEILSLAKALRRAERRW